MELINYVCENCRREISQGIGVSINAGLYDMFLYRYENPRTRAKLKEIIGRLDFCGAVCVGQYFQAAILIEEGKTVKKNK